MEAYEEHIKKCHEPVLSFECDIRTQEFQSGHELENQVKSEQCEKNDYKQLGDNELTKPTQKHSKRKNIECNQCIFQCQDANSFIAHLLEQHGNNSEMIQCPHCDYKSSDEGSLDFHIENNHVELALLGHISGNQDLLSKNFETFKDELTPMLNKFIDNHNMMKQELFIMRQNYFVTNDKLEKIESMIKNIMETSSCKTNEGSSSVLNAKIKPSVPQPKIQSPKPFNPISNEAKKEKVQDILFVGDSIAGNIHLPTIEAAVDADVKLVKAYSSIYENTNNAAHSAPRFPRKNFEDVITNEMSKSKHDVLIIQAGSVDITNLKTEAPNANDYLEYYKQKTIISSENIFQAAVNAESKYPELKKIVLMKQTPRYDSSTSNPPGLKPYLSQLFNDNLDKLFKSTQTMKIIIGNHNLDCHGGVFEARYRNCQTKKFDGIHLYGPSGVKAYTASVLNILSSAQLVVKTPPKYYDQYPHMKCPQAKYQAEQNYRRQTSTYRQPSNYVKPSTYRHEKSCEATQYSVPTKNKYSILADWVQGNY